MRPGAGETYRLTQIGHPERRTPVVIGECGRQIDREVKGGKGWRLANKSEKRRQRQRKRRQSRRCWRWRKQWRQQRRERLKKWKRRSGKGGGGEVMHSGRANEKRRQKAKRRRAMASEPDYLSGPLAYCMRTCAVIASPTRSTCAGPKLSPVARRPEQRPAAGSIFVPDVVVAAWRWPVGVLCPGPRPAIPTWWTQPGQLA